jgi:hypothetical protein
LAEDVATLASGYPGLARLVTATAGLATYIGNNFAAIADYAERWDHGEIISTAFAESTVDLVISRRFAKKQQMQWSKKGAHRLLQTRSRTLDGTLRDVNQRRRHLFRRSVEAEFSWRWEIIGGFDGQRRRLRGSGAILAGSHRGLEEQRAVAAAVQ